MLDITSQKSWRLWSVAKVTATIRISNVLLISSVLGILILTIEMNPRIIEKLVVDFRDSTLGL